MARLSWPVQCAHTVILRSDQSQEVPPQCVTHNTLVISVSPGGYLGPTWRQAADDPISVERFVNRKHRRARHLSTSPRVCVRGNLARWRHKTRWWHTDTQTHIHRREAETIKRRCKETNHRRSLIYTHYWRTRDSPEMYLKAEFLICVFKRQKWTELNTTCVQLEFSSVHLVTFHFIFFTSRALRP